MKERPSAHRTWLGALLGLATSALLAGCDDYPRDPNGTLERVTGGVMRVGLIARQPWVLPSEGSPEGVEVELVRELAAELGAEITWLTSREADVLDALKRHELDLVVGGLTSSNPWVTHVAFTRPFYREQLVVAAPAPVPLDDLEGIAVAVTPGSTAAALVAEHDGFPVPEDGATEYEVKTEWELEAAEHPVFVLHTDEHVFAVPQGENAWLIAVDRFLRGKDDAVRALLAAVE